MFRTATGAILSNAPMTKCCFEIDGWHDRTGTGWSVMVHGTVSEITDAADELGVSFRSLSIHSGPPGEREHWLALCADEVTGRHFTSGPLAPPVE